MRFPTERVTITAAECALLKPGFDLLSCSIADLKLGRLPHCYPFDRVDPPAAARLYKDRQFAPELLDRVVALRSKLFDISRSHKLRLTMIDLAALQFVARLFRLRNATLADEKTALAVERFEKKLEAPRRRAKRAAMKRLGSNDADAAQERWRRFVQWVRYYLLQFKRPKHRYGVPFLAERWRTQTEQLSAAVCAALEKNHYQQLSPERLKRVVDLLKSSLRRGRHPMTLMMILESPEQHFEFIVLFVQKGTP